MDNQLTFKNDIEESARRTSLRLKEIIPQVLIPHVPDLRLIFPVKVMLLHLGTTI